MYLFINQFELYLVDPLTWSSDADPSRSRMVWSRNLPISTLTLQCYRRTSLWTSLGALVHQQLSTLTWPWWHCMLRTLTSVKQFWLGLRLFLKCARGEARMTTELLHITTLGYHIYYSHHNNTMVYNVVMVMIPKVDEIFYTLTVNTTCLSFSAASFWNCNPRSTWRFQWKLFQSVA